MSRALVKWQVLEKGVKESPQEFHDAAWRGLGKVMELARQKARDNAPELSGRLKGSKGGMGQIRFELENGTVIRGTLLATSRDPVTGVDYAVFVHEGTGLHGPKKARIKPKKARVLVWLTKPGLPRPKTPAQWKEYRRKDLVVYARSTKGQKPNRFLLKGLKEAGNKAGAIFAIEMEELNRRVA